MVSERQVNHNPKFEGSHFYSTEARLQHIVIRIATHEATRNSNTVKLLYSYKLSILSGQILCLDIANAIVKKTDTNEGAYAAMKSFKNVLAPFHIDYLDCSEHTVYRRETSHILNCVAILLKKRIVRWLKGKKL